MQIYYPSLPAIEQQTRQLEHESCRHCQQTQQLVSHGRVYKKRTGAEPEAVGKRVLCSNRYHRSGCGRTMQLYLDTRVRYWHHTGQQVVAFLVGLVSGFTVGHAYYQATGTADARHAYRWLQRLGAQLSRYRSLWHRPPLSDSAVPAHPERRAVLTATVRALWQRFGPDLCTHYQRQTQCSFL